MDSFKVLQAAKKRKNPTLWTVAHSHPNVNFVRYNWQQAVRLIKIFRRGGVCIMTKPEYTGELASCIISRSVAFAVAQMCVAGPFLACKFVAVLG